MLAARPQPNLFEPAPAVSTRELPITFVISGDIPSKKNSKKIIQVKGRVMIVPSTHYEKWHRAAMKQIEWNEPNLPDGLAIEICIHPSTYRAGDLSNKSESILDLLVDKKIIRDDNWFVIPSVVLKFGGVDRVRPRAEVVISK